MKAQVKRQEEVAKAIFARRVHNLEQALKIAEQHNISRSETDVPADELPDSEMFLLGRPMLQARLKISVPLALTLTLITTKTAPCSIRSTSVQRWTRVFRPIVI